MKVVFFPIGEIEDNRLDFAVIAASFQGKWIFVRQKEHHAWEIPGGHREPDEVIEAAARRELYEETGALRHTLEAVCHYMVTSGDGTRYGALFHADITVMGPLPESEIDEIRLLKELPEQLTYPEIQPLLLQKVLEHMCQKAEAILLRDMERNINILNFMRNYPVNTVNIAGNSVLVRGKSDENWIYVSSQRIDELNLLLNSLDEGDECFAALEDWMLTHIVGTREVRSSLSSMKLIYRQQSPIPPVINDIVALSPDMAPYIFEHSKYKEFLCVEYIKERIQNGISLGILHQGKPVAWAITQDDGAIGFLHVLEEFRGKGYALSITRKMIQMLLERGQVPFVQIEEANLPSMSLALKAGFEKYGRVHWIYLKSQPS